MKIREFIIAPKKVQDTTSCGTTSCVTDSAMALDGLDWMISVILIVTVFIATLTLNCITLTV